MAYTAGQITSSGLVVAPLTGTSVAGLTGILDYLVQQMNTIYQAQLTTTSNTPDGQRLQTFAQVVQDILQLLLQLNASFDPTQAFGNILYQRGALVGIQPQNATYSTVAMTLVATGACTLYGLDQTAQPVYTFSDSNGNQWQLQTTLAITVAGTYAGLTFQAANPGPVEAAESTITTPVTVVLQISSGTNPAAAVPGTAQETDSAFKLRILQSGAIGSTGYLSGFIAALLNTAGIGYAIAYENDTGDANSYGQVAHSVWTIVSPGSATNAQIAQVIFAKHNAGCGIYVRTSESPTPNPQTYVIPATLLFSVDGANASAGAVYTNNGSSFTVAQSISGGSVLLVNQTSGLPTASGTLTLSSGTGDATIPFTAYQPGQAPVTVQWNELIEESLWALFVAQSLNGTTFPNLQSLVGVGSSLIPNPGESLNINQLTAALNLLDSNSLILFPNLTTGGSGLSTTSGTAGFSAIGAVSQLDCQLSLVSGAVIATMGGITQDFTGITGGPSSPKHQLQVVNPTGATYGATLSSGSFSALASVIQVQASSELTLDVYGGYFNGSPAAATLYLNNSGGTVSLTASESNPCTVTYTAGSTSGGYDVIEISDTLGNVSYVAIQVISA